MQKKGFTLLEVLIVVVILASVVLFGVPSYKKTQARAKYNASLGTLVQLGEGLRMLYKDSGKVWNQDAKGLNKSNTFKEELIANIELSEDFVLSDLNLSDKSDQDAFLAALIARGYMTMPRFEETLGYNYYICPIPGDKASACCPVNNEDVIACMEITTCSDTNKEYAGAYFLKDGTYQRIARHSCN